MMIEGKVSTRRLTNAHVATLATCLWATKSRGVSIALDAQDSMVNTPNGGLVSLGGIKKRTANLSSWVFIRVAKRPIN